MNKLIYTPTEYNTNSKTKSGKDNILVPENFTIKGITIQKDTTKDSFNEKNDKIEDISVTFVTDNLTRYAALEHAISGWVIKFQDNARKKSASGLSLWEDLKKTKKWRGTPSELYNGHRAIIDPATVYTQKAKHLESVEDKMALFNTLDKDTQSQVREQLKALSFLDDVEEEVEEEVEEVTEEEIEDLEEDLDAIQEFEKIPA